MRSPFTARDRRALSVGTLLVLGIVTASRGIPAMRQWEGEARVAATELLAEAERAERSVHRLEATLDSLEQRRDRLISMAELLVGGSTIAAAGVDLTSRISSAAAAARVQVGAMQVLADTAEPGVFARVSVRAQLTGDIRGIARLLSDLEKGPPLLSMREWSISQPDAAAPGSQAEALRLDLTVEALGLNRDAGEDP